jgi:D-3-phosphoglycerate dehydrogenase
VKILITADFSEDAVKRLKTYGHEVRLGGWGVSCELLNEDELIQEIGDSDVVMVGYEPITPRVLDETNLKVICSIRGGPQANIDIKYATKLGIPIIYTKGREAIPVADFTFGQIIGLTRRIVQTDRELRSGKFTMDPKKFGSKKDVIWDMSADGPWQSRKGIELAGKTLGLVGFGTVGQAVARRAQGFELRVLAYDPYMPEAVFQENGAIRSDLETLLRESDIVSIHVMASEKNRGMIGEKEFALMKNGAFFINNARASVVDEKAMRKAILSGKLGGAALDVHHQEPIRSDDELFSLDNVVLTPHIAGAGLEVIYRHSNMLVDDFLRLMEGKMPRAVYNPETLKGNNRLNMAIEGV